MNPARLSSWCLLGGIAVGFLTAVWTGHGAARYSKPSGFQRFHQRISPDALFYPPYAMLERLALARWQPGRTLVIIGGNSILNGVGQPEDELWSARLQYLLGDGYVVVNLAFRASAPTQGAALVAESLLQRGYPVIYVANSNPTASTGRAAEGWFGYFYWQALAQHRLADYPPRTAEINRWLDALPPAARRQQEEVRLDARLEAFTRHQSLWHHLGYRYVFTVWTSLLADHFWIARDRLIDNEPYPPPVEDRFHDYLEQEMAIVRGMTQSLAYRDATGGWRYEEGNRRRLEADIEASFPPALRLHTLMLLNKNAPYYLARLTPEERAQDAFVYEGCARIWREHGIACVVAGDGFETADYLDRAHLTSDGGNKLAALVAEQIRNLHPQ